MFFLLVPIGIYLAIKWLFFSCKTKSIDNRHVVIVGGSSGIGKATAVLAAKQGAHVTIIAQDLRKLNLAKVELTNACVNEKQEITAVSLDVTNYDSTREVFNEIDARKPIYMLINCAGKAICGELEKMKVEDIKSIVDLNLLGTIYATQCAIPMLKSRREGIIVIVASQASLIGIYGLSVYSASKYALKGFAEAIDMELQNYNVNVTLAVPPDTDTPGFQNENKSKPEETMLISSTGGLFNPDVIAKHLLKDALSNKFFSYVGFASFTMTTLNVGMTRSSLLPALVQAMLLGPLRLIGLLYMNSFQRIIRRCHQMKLKKN
ncbi:hypothetical protein FQA39_LY04817 [Lamprigera yunnana]|nr:hypothetical protein FQA39_LY04817 [Lamprigera yunnana]